MAGGGSGTTTVQKADPWIGVQDYLKNLYSNANSYAAQGGPEVAQNSGVAPLGVYQQQVLGQMNQRSYGSPYEQKGLDLLDNIANGSDNLSVDIQRQLNGATPEGTALTNAVNGNDATTQYLKSVLGGKYLSPDSNPYLKGAVDAASSDATRNFQTAVMPQLASQFSLAGRYGSGAQSQGVSDATNNLAQQLSNTAANIYNTNYQNERSNQTGAASTLGNYLLNATGQLGNLRGNAASLLSGRQLTAGSALPGMSQQIDYNNLNQRQNVASILQEQAQNELTGQNALVNANAQRPYQNLNWLNGILSGAMSLNGQSSQQQQQTNPFKSAVGGGLSGAATGAAVGSVVPGLGTAAGAAIGGVGGLLMGVL
jgi:hypothetical protein